MFGVCSEADSQLQSASSVLVKINPYRLRSMNHNHDFQLPVCNFYFRHNFFIIRCLYRFK